MTPPPPPAAPDPMAEIDIEEGKRLLEAMSEGPWGCWNAYGPLEDGLMRCLYIGKFRPGGICSEIDSEDICGPKADLEGVAWLRNSAPALLSRLSAAEQEAERLRGAIGEVMPILELFKRCGEQEDWCDLSTEASVCLGKFRAALSAEASR